MMLPYSFSTGLFLLSDLLIYLLYRRVGGDLQLFTCVGICSFPLALFPYIYMLIPYNVARCFLLFFQIWNLLLLLSALCFGNGLRLDRLIIVSLTILYFNIFLLIFL